MRSDAEVQAALEVMERRSHGEYKSELAVLDRRDRHATDARGSRLARIAHKTYLEDHGGHPLGKGMPTGDSWRQDGEPHRAAWMRVVRGDPCAFCGKDGGTVDHIEPRSQPARGLGGAHCWLNYTGACMRCNGNKGALCLLEALYRRRWGTGWTPTRSQELRASRAGNAAVP